jgi:hypothetical protein
MVTDEIVARVRQASESLIKKHGGFDGWVKHLIAKCRRRELAEKRVARPGAKKRRRYTSRSK